MVFSCHTSKLYVNKTVTYAIWKALFGEMYIVYKDVDTEVMSGLLYRFRGVWSGNSVVGAATAGTGGAGGL